MNALCNHWFFTGVLAYSMYIIFFFSRCTISAIICSYSLSTLIIFSPQSSSTMSLSMLHILLTQFSLLIYIYLPFLHNILLCTISLKNFYSIVYTSFNCFYFFITLPVLFSFSVVIFVFLVIKLFYFSQMAV